jgi:hypothetical protein
LNVVYENSYGSVGSMVMVVVVDLLQYPLAVVVVVPLTYFVLVQDPSFLHLFQILL